MSFEAFEGLAEKPKTSTDARTLFDIFAEADSTVTDIEFELPPRSKARRPPVDFD